MPVLIALAFYGMLMTAPPREDSAADVAAALFPSELRSEPGLTADDLTEDSAGAELTRVGKDRYIVASYTNLHRGIVRVLAHREGRWSVVADWEVAEMVTSPDITLHDFDADGTPEVIAGFQSGGHAWDQQWILRWTGSALEPMVDDAAGRNALMIYDIVDIDGDGDSEIINTDLIKDEECECDYPWVPRLSVFAMTGSTFRRGSTLEYFVSLPVPKKTPSITTEEFSASSPGDKYVLRLVRSGDKGQWNLKDGRVELNGVTVLDRPHLTARDATIAIPVSLRAQNTITIRINAAITRGAGPADPKQRVLTVLIEPVK